MKAQNCQRCAHSHLYKLFDKLVCFKGHKPRFYGYKPRFYNPKSPTDDKWGWKRRCGDFEKRK